MSIDKTKPAILYCVKNKINSLVYYGMIHKKGKTIEQRLNDHINGKKSGAGVFLHQAICELGAENFFIEEVATGTFEDISSIEKERTQNTLWVKGEGYNGNSGRCIILNDEMYSRKLANTDMVKRSERWHETYNKNRHLHNYTRSPEYKQKMSDRPTSYKGKKKEDCEVLMKRSINMKERCKNPTDKMIEGRKRGNKTRTGRNKYNNESIRRRAEKIKELGIMKGKNSPSWSGYWVTPLGRFVTAKEAAIATGLGLATLQTWCRKSKIIETHHHTSNNLVDKSWDGKTTTDVGFYKSYT